MATVSYYTEQGIDQLKRKLRLLQTVERSKVADQLAEARGRGDLSENAEYDAAKEAQGLLEAEIARLEGVLASAKVISEADIDPSRVSVLSKVKIKNKHHGQELMFTLVSKEEADLKLGKLSVESPIGKGLLGKRAGDTAVIDTPSGKQELEIVAVTV